MSGNFKSNPEYSRLLHEYILLPGKIPLGVPTDKIDLSTPLTKYIKDEEPVLTLNVPILSAAMQAVTGSRMAIAMARLGGAGVIYCSQPVEQEAAMVREVKEYKAGFVVPDVFSPDDLIEDVQKRIEEKGYSTFPITENGEPDSELVGYLTGKDFHTPLHSRLRVKERMIPIEKISYALLKDVANDENVPDLNKANEILMEGHHGSLPILDDEMNLLYVVFRKDVKEHLENPLELLDNKKRLVCGAAANTHDYEKRIPTLADAGADFYVIDTSQAYSEYAERCLKYLKNNFPDTPVIAGNVVTKDGFKFLVDNGADAVKVGMGSSYICITQEQIKVGRGQATAVIDVANARNDLYEDEGVYIPIISDGGIRTSGDIIAALALGADSVMVGGYVVGTEESNSTRRSKRIYVNNRPTDVIVKDYWGEGSVRARQWAEKRYGHISFEEGIEIEVPYVGSLKAYMEGPLATIRDGIRKAGCINIKELHEKAKVEVYSPLAISVSAEKHSGLPTLSKTRS